MPVSSVVLSASDIYTLVSIYRGNYLAEINPCLQDSHVIYVFKVSSILMCLIFRTSSSTLFLQSIIQMVLIKLSHAEWEPCFHNQLGWLHEENYLHYIHLQKSVLFCCFVKGKQEKIKLCREKNVSEQLEEITSFLTYDELYTFFVVISRISYQLQHFEHCYSHCPFTVIQKHITHY